MIPAPGRRAAVLSLSLLLHLAVAGAPGRAEPAAPATSPEPVAGEGASPFPASGWPLLVVALDGLDWDWIGRFAVADRTPHLQEFVARSALAVYNPLAGPRERPAAYLSAALGYPVEQVQPVSLGGGPRSRDVFVRRVGFVPAAPPGAYLVLDWPRLSREARGSGSFAPPGWLGEGLGRAGVRTALLGDPILWPSDDGSAPRHGAAPGSPLSLAGLWLVDAQGVLADVYPLAAGDAASPGGLRTRWEDVPQVLASLAPPCAGCAGGGGRRVAAVVASGDLWRVLEEEPEMAPAAALQHHRALAQRLDRVVRWWEAHPFWGRGSLLLLGAGAAPYEGREARGLTAMIWRGPWKAGPIYSPTSRRAGFVTAVDVAPTLARMAGVPVPGGVVGRAVSLSAPAPSPEALREFSRTRELISRLRLRVLSPLITAQVAALALGLALAALHRLLPRGGAMGSSPAGKVLRLAPAWACAVPLALLHPWVAAPPVAGLAGPAWAVGAAAGAAAGVAAGCVRAGSRLGVSAVSLVAALTAAALVADLALGLDLVARSFMGFDLVGAARLYGIGNEHAGLLVGSAMVAAGELVLRRPRMRGPVAVMLLALPWLVGSPTLGANVGGSLAASAAVGACVAGWYASQRPHLRVALGRAGAGLALAGIVLGAAALQDVGATAARRTHLALTVQAAREVGPEYVVAVAERKLALNWRLLRYSVYSRIMFVAMLVVMAAFWAPGGGLWRSLEGRPALRLALEACALGAAVALVANDSGVTAAAGALLAPAAWVLELSLADGARRR